MKRIPTYVLLVLGSLLFSVPFLFTISTALKSSAEYAKEPGRLIPAHPDFSNFAKAWTALPFPTFVWNTILITIICTVAQVISGSLVAYGFSRFTFKWRNFLFFVMLGTMMLPGQVTQIPVFLVWRKLHAA